LQQARGRYDSGGYQNESRFAFLIIKTVIHYIVVAHYTVHLYSPEGIKNKQAQKKNLT